MLRNFEGKLIILIGKDKIKKIKRSGLPKLVYLLLQTSKTFVCFIMSYSFFNNYFNLNVYTK